MKKCLRCKKEFTGHKNKVYCSSECRPCVANLRLISDGLWPNGRPASGTIGAIHELEVSADLMRKGFAVFRALSPHCKCDLIVWKNSRLLKVEVTCGVINVGGSLSHPHKTTDRIFDLLAVVERGGKILYFPEDLLGLAAA